MNPTELLNYGKGQLGERNLNDARILIEHCLKLKPSEFYFSKKSIKTREKNSYQKLLDKRKNGLPTAYITEETEFMGLKFFVNKNVLIPRQETEILIEEVLKLLPTSHFPLPTILDIGTGSGNIAISLAKYISDAKIIATDISKEALGVAKKNAKLNDVSDKITFLQSNLFNLLPSTFYLLPSFDLIISNPPYIKNSEIKKLQKEIQHEPKIALDGGKDGLNFYKKIVLMSRKLLKKNGFLMFEIGYHHSQKIKKMMAAAKFRNIKIVNDYSQQERVIYGQNSN
ncbi:MAG TPA: peptide chain release factor N(5)-glutamine methyltransferase [Elusimicrobia bacterium]|nr:peptide chain release factor N(5)-glutamine methyltransferase [Elusimicrobiota bacterium]